MSSDNAPPPRPPPVALSTVYDSPAGPLFGGQFMNSFQPQYLGLSAPNYGMYDPYNRVGFFGGGRVSHISPESNFIRLAEESSRSAFQSIESVVNAVASVSNMLNSMHSAVFNSFRAVVGVVDQLRLFKQQTAYAFFAFIQYLRFFWRKILIWMSLRPKNYINSDVWSSIVDRKSGQKFINWSALCFWLIVVGGPYLIYKCVSQMVQRAEQSQKWATGDEEHYTAQALYNFDALNNQELSFCAYDMLRIAPKSQQPKIRDWLLASTNDGKHVGLVPINYIKLINRNLTNSPPLLSLTKNKAQSISSDLNSTFNFIFKNQQ